MDTFEDVLIVDAYTPSCIEQPAAQTTDEPEPLSLESIDEALAGLADCFDRIRQARVRMTASQRAEFDAVLALAFS
jgi:hypothetical protein